MGHKKTRTKDEKLIVCLYETALDANDIHAEYSRYVIGNKIGLHPKGIDTICVLLLQANFIKKGEGDNIYLTKNGEELVHQILRE